MRTTQKLTGRCVRFWYPCVQPSAICSRLQHFHSLFLSPFDRIPLPPSFILCNPTHRQRENREYYLIIDVFHAVWWTKYQWRVCTLKAYIMQFVLIVPRRIFANRILFANWNFINLQTHLTVRCYVGDCPWNLLEPVLNSVWKRWEIKEFYLIDENGRKYQKVVSFSVH